MNISQRLGNADLMVAAQHFDKALATYNQIINEKNNCDEAYLLRGELYGKLGQYKKALSDVLKAISIDPDYNECYMVLASLYLAQNKSEKAIEAYQKAITLNNNQAATKLVQLTEKLADQQLATHQPDKAIDNYRLAIKYSSDNINLLYKHAFAVARIGDFAQATDLIEAILRLDPDHIPAKSLLISVYEKTGQQEKGWQQINTLVNAYPDNAHISIIYGKYALQNNKQAHAIKYLKNNIQKSGIKIDDQLSLHMLLGKLYDSISDYENAFIHFSQANSLKYNDYDVATFETQVNSYIDYFSKEKYSQLASSYSDSEMPVFILGMPRSGSSLIEQIIASHSQVHGGGELQFIPGIAQSMEKSAMEKPAYGRSYPQLLDNIDGQLLDSYAEKLLRNMQALSPASPRITDKLPHNFLFVGLIHKLLPNAKIIHCLRNPIDTCLSCYFQHFGGYHPYAYNLSNLGKYYRQYTRLMKHWEKELDVPILNVNYENLVSNTKAELERLLDYLELDWEDDCLKFYKQKRSINTSSYTQVTKKIYTTSTGRWQNYKSFIPELITILGE